MNHVAVTIELPVGNTEAKRRDLGVPLDVPIGRLARALARDLHIPLPPGQTYRMAIEADGTLRFLPEQATLGQMRILHGMVLRLVPYAAPASIRKRAYLCPDGEATSIPLEKSTVLIGRPSPKQGVFVDIDASALASKPQGISRRHAQIEYRDGTFYIRDLGSKNGTFVNGQRLAPDHPRPLSPGDVIELGRSGTLRLIFEYDDD